MLYRNALATAIVALLGVCVAEGLAATSKDSRFAWIYVPATNQTAPWLPVAVSSDHVAVSVDNNVVVLRVRDGAASAPLFPVNTSGTMPPVVAAGLLIQCGGATMSDWYTYNLSTGQPGWSIQGGPSCDESLMAIGDTLLVSNTSGAPFASSDVNTATLMDATTGKTRAMVELSSGYNTPAFTATGNGTVVASGNGNLTLFALADGRVLASVNATSAVVTDGVVIASNGVALDARTGKLLWTCSAIALLDLNSLILADELAVGMVGSTVYALDRASGELRWTASVPAGAFWWALTARPGAVLVVSQNTSDFLADNNTVTALSTASGSVLWTYLQSLDTLCVPFAQPVGDSVYIGVGSTLLKVAALTGKDAWTVNRTDLWFPFTVANGRGYEVTVLSDGNPAIPTTVRRFSLEDGRPTGRWVIGSTTSRTLLRFGEVLLTQSLSAVVYAIPV